MKTFILKFPNQSFAIDDATVDPSLAYHMTGHNSIILAAGLDEVEIFSTATDLELPFTPSIQAEELHRFAASLVSARIAAKLRAPHITTIINDHAEFVTCMLIEQQYVIANAVRLSPGYVQDMINTAAARVTAAWIEEDDNHTVSRSASDRLAVYIPQGRPQLLLRQQTGTVLREVTIYRGTEAECKAAMLKVNSTPWQEAITRVELDRWVKRHTQDLELVTPSQPTSVPCRSITIPGPR